MPDRAPEAPTPPRRALDRRGFLGVAGGTALLCGLGGRPITERTVAEVDQADAAARALPRPKAAASDPIDSTSFTTPQPQPGGQKREYWIAAHAPPRNLAPTRRAHPM